jgi:hypothetical protein
MLYLNAKCWLLFVSVLSCRLLRIAFYIVRRIFCCFAVLYAPATTVEDLILLLRIFERSTFQSKGARLNHVRGQDPVEIFCSSHRRQGGGVEGR